MNVFINSINISGNNGVFDGKLALTVQNKTQLNNLINKMKKIEGVTNIERVNSF